MSTLQFLSANCFLLSKSWCISSRDHLRIYIWFCPVNITDFLNIRWTYFTINLKCPVSSSKHSLRNGNPRIVVAENSCIFFISRRIRSNFPKFQMVSCISRLKDHYSILCFQQFIHRVQSFFCYSFFLADSCHNTESLWFNKNLSFFAFF